MALCFILFNGVNFSLDGLVGTAFKLTEIAGITRPQVVLKDYDNLKCHKIQRRQ